MKSYSILFILSFICVGGVLCDWRYGYAWDYNTYVEVEHKSFVENFGDSLIASIFGFIFLAAGFFLLYWNEGRAVKTELALIEGSRLVQTINAYDPSYDQKLVHITSNAASADSDLEDKSFGIKLPALKLKRKVEVYQWQETSSSKTQKEVGGGSTTTKVYNYHTDWSENLINSSTFKMPHEHQNPTHVPFKSVELISNRVIFNQFLLPQDLLSKLNNYKQLTLNPGIYQLLNPELQGRVVLQNNTLYIGDPAFPRVGDIRLSFYQVEAGQYTVVAKQSGNTFVPHTSQSGNQISLISPGNLSAHQMFQNELASNRTLTWVLRFVGIFVLFIAALMVTTPLCSLIDIIPFFGDIVRLGTLFFALTFSTIAGIITIAIAWLRYRPQTAFLLIALVICILFLSATSAPPQKQR